MSVGHRRDGMKIPTATPLVIIRAGVFAPQIEEVRTGETLIISLGSITRGLIPRKENIAPPQLLPQRDTNDQRVVMKTLT